MKLIIVTAKSPKAVFTQEAVKYFKLKSWFFASYRRTAGAFPAGACGGGCPGIRFVSTGYAEYGIFWPLRFFGCTVFCEKQQAVSGRSDKGMKSFLKSIQVKTSGTAGQTALFMFGSSAGPLPACNLCPAGRRAGSHARPPKTDPVEQGSATGPGAGGFAGQGRRRAWLAKLQKIILQICAHSIY